MGPYSSVRGLVIDNRKRHEKCREKGSCNGPGCKVYTGKTERKRKRHG